jgi:hypothetical protein
MTEGKKRVTVFVNGKRVGGRVIYVPKKWPEFLKVAGRKFGVNATRVFNEEGGELDELELISNKDVLFLSAGENFLPPSTIDHQGTFMFCLLCVASMENGERREERRSG